MISTHFVRLWRRDSETLSARSFRSDPSRVDFSSDARMYSASFDVRLLSSVLDASCQTIEE